MSNDTITFRVSDPQQDYRVLVDLLMEPGVLRFFPMNDLVEVEDAAKVWISYGKIKACFTMLKNNKPIGICGVYPHYAKKIAHQSLVSVVLTENERGKGYGRKLMEYVEHRSKVDFKMTLLHLEVYEGNPAIHLYKKLGYTIYGNHKKFLKEGKNIYRDKILMQKWIG